MSQTAIIGAVVLMMMCCSSSVGAFFLMGGEESTGSSGSGGGGGDDYTYDFIIKSHNEHDTIRTHIADIKADGVRVASSKLTMHVQPDRYNCGTDTDACLTDETIGYLDAAGDSTWSAWNDGAYAEGAKIFTVKSPTKVSTFEISYQRPKYAPAWIIKENGTAVVTETSNRGGEATPSPVTYTYTIP